MPRYPHMLPREGRIWDEYVRQYGLPGGEISYDVHLGDGVAVDPSWPPWMAAVVVALSRHRADAVAVREVEVEIFEIKSVAGMSAVGQLLGYEALWLREHGTRKQVNLTCVCEQAEADMRAVFQFYDVRLVELGPLGGGEVGED